VTFATHNRAGFLTLGMGVLMTIDTLFMEGLHQSHDSSLSLECMTVGAIVFARVHIPDVLSVDVVMMAVRALVLIVVQKMIEFHSGSLSVFKSLAFQKVPIFLGDECARNQNHGRKATQKKNSASHLLLLKDEKRKKWNCRISLLRNALHQYNILNYLDIKNIGIIFCEYDSPSLTPNLEQRSISFFIANLPADFLGRKTHLAGFARKKTVITLLDVISLCKTG
jgi:hypothetical protein